MSDALFVDLLRNNASQNLGANIDDVRHMEEKMLRLLEDFEAGKIVSVGTLFFDISCFNFIPFFFGRVNF